MKLLLIGNYINDQQFSINRFVRLLEKGLSQKGFEVRRIQPEQVLGQLRPSVGGLGKWLGWKLLTKNLYKSVKMSILNKIIVRFIQIYYEETFNNWGSSQIKRCQSRNH